MSPLTKTAISLALVVATATNAAAGTKFSYHDGQTVLSALSGNSVIGQLSDGQSYCEYHDQNSAVFGRDYQVYSGNWRVAENYVCYQYPGAN